MTIEKLIRCNICTPEYIYQPNNKPAQVTDLGNLPGSFLNCFYLWFGLTLLQQSILITILVTAILALHKYFQSPKQKGQLAILNSDLYKSEEKQKTALCKMLNN